MSKTRKVVIVVGASGGIGAPFVHELVIAGYCVTLMARRREKLLSVAQRHPKDRVLVAQADATKPADVRRVFKTTMRKFGRVDGLILLAGTWKRLSVRDSVAKALKVSDDLYCSIYLPSYVPAHFAQQFFREQGYGLIAGMSSHAGLDPELKSNLSYGSMKAATHQHLLAMRHELKGTRVRVTDMVPAIVNTPDNAKLLKTAQMKKGAVQPEKMARWLIKNFGNQKIQATKRFPSKVVLK